MRRLVLALVVLLVAVFAIGCGRARGEARADAKADVEVRHHTAVAKHKTFGKLVHFEKRADAMYDDDDDDDGDDDDVAGLAPPQTDDDDDDASPQPTALATERASFAGDDPPAFVCAEDALGPARGHRRADDPPPRA